MTSLHDQLHIDPHASLPIVAQIQRQVAWLIVSGNLKAGDRLPPIRELADHLGVHMHTIRFAYQRLEAEGLVSARRGRGTTVLSPGAMRLKSPAGHVRSYSIGVLIPDLNPFYLPLLRGIDEACREIPALYLLSKTHDNPLLAETIIQQMIVKNVDGLILVSTGFDWSETLENLPPIIFIDEPDVNQNVIQFDSQGAGYQATKHLIAHGHTEITLLTASLIFPQAQSVYQGYLNALEESGLPVGDDWILEVPDFTAASASAGMGQRLETGKQPTAVVASADSLAIGALKAINEHGLRVPQDIALVGYNDIEFAALLNPALTTVSLPAYQAGFQAVQSLELLRAGKQLSPSRVILESQLVIRESCGCSGAK